jgi:hypothetical protein
MGFVPLPILQLLVFSVGWVECGETHHGAERGGLNGYAAVWGEYHAAADSHRNGAGAQKSCPWAGLAAIPSWRTLYELTKLPDLGKRLHVGEVTPDIYRNDHAVLLTAKRKK